MPRLPRSNKRRRAATEERIRSLAARQHGVVTRAQLLAAGLGPDRVDRRLATGDLHPIHRGVYAVGPVTAPRRAEMAAVLACGAEAVVSHVSAGMLWQFLPSSRGDAGAVDVSLRAGNRCRPGIRIHRAHTLRPGEVTRLDGIPVTTPARTLLDLASTEDLRALDSAVARAIAARLTTRGRILALLRGPARRPGASLLRAVLSARPALTRSEAEERLLALVRKARLPEPSTNVPIHGYEVDFLWREEGLVVEVDGFAFHASRESFERDRRRDAVLAAAGLRVIRITWRQLEGEPEAVLVRVAQALIAARCA
jgi:very-short-patch-repair endonuclease/predicted transcriptional regulator of viral defense system